MVKVRCLKCGSEEEVVFGQCLARGWPLCCDETMALITKPTQDTVDAAVEDLFKLGRHNGEVRP